MSKINSVVKLGSVEYIKRHKHKEHNPIAPNLADIVEWQLYDTVTTAANTATSASYTFFNQPIGTSSKTKADTNLEQVSRLPDPQVMYVQSLGFQFSTDMIKADIDQFLNGYWFEFWVSQKVYAEGPLQTAPSGYGLYGATTRSNEGGWSSGVPGGENIQFNTLLPPPFGDGCTGISILQGQTFYVKVIAGTTFTTAVSTSPTNGVGLKLKCFLTGVLSRQVQ